jgi:hypothetical protein
LRHTAIVDSAGLRGIRWFAAATIPVLASKHNGKKPVFKPPFQPKSRSYRLLACQPRPPGVY